MVTAPPPVTVEVVPVAGHDSMLLNLSGAHGPFFTRNLASSPTAPATSASERCPAAKRSASTIEDARALVVGQPIGEYARLLRDMRDLRRPRRRRPWACRPSTCGPPSTRSPRRDRRCSTCSVSTSRCRWPRCSATGSSGTPCRSWDTCSTSATAPTDLPYAPKDADAATGCASATSRRSPRRRRPAWPRPPRPATASTTSSSRAACCAAKNEVAPSRALADRFPHARITLDPNGGWLLKDAIALCRDLRGVLAYAEDPSAPKAASPAVRRWPSSARHRAAHRDQHDRHRLATDGARRPLRRGRHPAGRPTLLDHARLRARRSTAATWGLTWGSHSNNHFDISLAMFTHVGAAPGAITALDTHWIWQDGQRLTRTPLPIRDGPIKVPTAPGLGVELDRDAPRVGARAVPRARPRRPG